MQRSAITGVVGPTARVLCLCSSGQCIIMPCSAAAASWSMHLPYPIAPCPQNTDPTHCSRSAAAGSPAGSSVAGRVGARNACVFVDRQNSRERPHTETYPANASREGRVQLDAALRAMSGVY